jgi:restriction system protein
MSAVTLWMVRAGRHGEGENDALNDHVVGIGWPELGDLAEVGSAGNIRCWLDAAHPDARPSTLASWSGQIDAFRFCMEAGDLVALPLKSAPAVAFGRIAGGYRYAPEAVDALRHQRAVQWISEGIPRDLIDQDLLSSLGAFLTVCRISRNDAERRVQRLLAAWSPGAPDEPPLVRPEEEEVAEPDAAADRNLGEEGREQIRRRVARQFQGHDLARLVGALLRAEGFSCEVSPPGPGGGGVDILAGPGGMGFEGTTVAVQVKPGSAAVDAATLRELKCVMGNFGARQGLLVSWGGFTRIARQEARRLFFEIRLWDSDAVIDKLEEVYDRLPADIRAELPLQRVWALLPEGG